MVDDRCLYNSAELYTSTCQKSGSLLLLLPTCRRSLFMPDSQSDNIIRTWLGFFYGLKLLA
jgi:hypothetical protein